MSINMLWFLSLCCSLLSALTAMLGKQWVRQYSSSLSGAGAHLYRARRHQAVLFASKRWHISEVLSFIPIPMHIALFLFFIGLLLFIWNDSPAIVAVVTPLCVIGLILYGVVTSLPSYIADFPFGTPFSPLLPKVVNEEVEDREQESYSSSWLDAKSLAWLTTYSTSTSVVRAAAAAVSGLEGNQSQQTILYRSGFIHILANALLACTMKGTESLIIRYEHMKMASHLFFSAVRLLQDSISSTFEARELVKLLQKLDHDIFLDLRQNIDATNLADAMWCLVAFRQLRPLLKSSNQLSSDILAHISLETVLSRSKDRNIEMLRPAVALAMSYMRDDIHSFVWAASTVVDCWEFEGRPHLGKVERYILSEAAIMTFQPDGSLISDTYLRKVVKLDFFAELVSLPTTFSRLFLAIASFSKSFADSHALTRDGHSFSHPLQLTGELLRRIVEHGSFLCAPIPGSIVDPLLNLIAIEDSALDSPVSSPAASMLAKLANDKASLSLLVSENVIQLLLDAVTTHNNGIRTYFHMFHKSSSIIAKHARGVLLILARYQPCHAVLAAQRHLQMLFDKITTWPNDTECAFAGEILCLLATQEPIHTEFMAPKVITQLVNMVTSESELPASVAKDLLYSISKTPAGIHGLVSADAFALLAGDVRLGTDNSVLVVTLFQEVAKHPFSMTALATADLVSRLIALFSSHDEHQRCGYPFSRCSEMLDSPALRLLQLILCDSACIAGLTLPHILPRLLEKFKSPCISLATCAKDTFCIISQVPSGRKALKSADVFSALVECTGPGNFQSGTAQLAVEFFEVVAASLEGAKILIETNVLPRLFSSFAMDECTFIDNSYLTCVMKFLCRVAQTDVGADALALELARRDDLPSYPPQLQIILPGLVEQFNLASDPASRLGMLRFFYLIARQEAVAHTFVQSGILDSLAETLCNTTHGDFAPTQAAGILRLIAAKRPTAVAEALLNCFDSRVMKSDVVRTLKCPCKAKRTKPKKQVLYHSDTCYLQYVVSEITRISLELAPQLSNYKSASECSFDDVEWLIDAIMSSGEKDAKGGAPGSA
jgi:hypothetical protein